MVDGLRDVSGLVSSPLVGLAEVFLARPNCSFTVAGGMLFLERVGRIEVGFEATQACVVADLSGTVRVEPLIAIVRGGGCEATVVDAR